jgi:hypothetical protein
MTDQQEQNKPEYTFDFDRMPLTKNLIDLHQEGNYLIGITERGVKFRQHIPANKLLTKEGDQWRLIDRVAA